VIAVVMGVSGAGKTTIGEALARALRWRFLDAALAGSVEFDTQGRKDDHRRGAGARAPLAVSRRRPGWIG
jgi:molybdopterin-guanine dinucleotide biosynthesis protein